MRRHFANLWLIFVHRMSFDIIFIHLPFILLHVCFHAIFLKQPLNIPREKQISYIFHKNKYYIPPLSPKISKIPSFLRLFKKPKIFSDPEIHNCNFCHTFY